MTILTTTLAQLRKHGACVEGYNRLVRTLRGKPFTYEDEERVTHIRFKHKGNSSRVHTWLNGLDDALFGRFGPTTALRETLDFSQWLLPAMSST